MTKQLEVDIEKSLELWHQENGRIKPAEKKDYARVSIKIFICPECHHSIEVNRTSFGETILCPNCKVPMIQQ